MDTRGRFALVLVLRRLWARLQRRHPRLPAVALVPVPGLISRYGARPSGVAIHSHHSVLLVPEDGSAYELLHATLHGAAVFLTYALGHRPRTNNRRYSVHFATSALALDLSVEFTKARGYGATSVSVETLVRFGEDLSALVQVLTAASQRADEPGSAPQHIRS